MSLYCIGKVVPAQQHRADFVFPRGVTVVNRIDPDDRKEFDTFEQLAGDGVFFNVLDGPNAYEATGLWNEASIQARDMVIGTPLGGFVRALMFDRRIEVAGLTFVDGGIETIIEVNPDQCWQGFLDRINKRWDAMDNPLFIWRSQ
jgi:hypothetical protein